MAVKAKQFLAYIFVFMLPLYRRLKAKKGIAAVTVISFRFMKDVFFDSR